MTQAIKKTTQMTVVIPSDLHKKLKIHAIKEGSTIVTTVVKFIEQGLGYVKENKKEEN